MIADIGRRIQTPSPKVLTLDIERLPGRAKVKHRGLTIEGDFWDLSGWKHTIGYRIHADDVIEWPRTICLAWRWYGSKRVEFVAEWQDGGPEAMLSAGWDAYNRADIIVGHNVQAFDTKHLNTGWRDLGYAAPSPFKIVDTLKEARKHFGDESKTLDAMCRRLGIPAKTDKYSVEVARAACEGNKAAQRKLAGYNRGDIVATEALYDRLRGWMHTHPHVGKYADDTPRCNQCGSADLQPNGTTRAVLIDYALYRCGNCGANVKAGWHSRAATTRGAG